jgi:hypothetical protein
LGPFRLRLESPTKEVLLNYKRKKFYLGLGASNT